MPRLDKAVQGWALFVVMPRSNYAAISSDDIVNFKGALWQRFDIVRINKALHSEGARTNAPAAVCSFFIGGVVVVGSSDCHGSINDADI